MPDISFSELQLFAYQRSFCLGKPAHFVWRRLQCFDRRMRIKLRGRLVPDNFVAAMRHFAQHPSVAASCKAESLGLWIKPFVHGGIEAD